MNPTKNDLALDTRSKMVELLNARLADTIDLFNQLKQAHWNVKGPHFRALHELFDDLAEHAEEWSDELAERAVALGGIARGTSGTVAKQSSLPAYGEDLLDGAAHVAALSTAMAKYAANFRAAIDAADAAGDKVTADLFNEITAGADKDLWFLESHLQR